MTNPAIRKIIHIDMDAFYASVELRERPELRGRPLVVAWEGARSVVCAASYEARRWGLHSAMSSAAARRRCPQAVFVPPRFDLYRSVSQQIHEVFARYSDVVEPLSLDEAYLDVSANKLGLATAGATARQIRADILDATGLTASAGVAPNKFLAKIASDWRKPNGQFVLPPHKVDAFLAVLPLGKIPGVGRVTLNKLHALKLYTWPTCSAVTATACTIWRAAATTGRLSPTASGCRFPPKPRWKTICHWSRPPPCCRSWPPICGGRWRAKTCRRAA